MSNVFKGYICSLTAQYHIPDDWDGIEVYFSEASLRAHKSCLNDTSRFGCTVVEIDIILPLKGSEEPIKP